MSVVLITGSSGLIGSETVSFFCEKGFDVIGLDNDYRKIFFGNISSTISVKNTLNKKFKNYKHINLDIRNNKGLIKIFKKYKKNIQLIIHSAAQPSHDYAKDFPLLDFDINARSTLNLLELTKKYCFESPFIFMSTNKVYGDLPNYLNFKENKTRYELETTDKNFNGIDENFSIDKSIHSLFGVSKCYADLVVQEYGKNFGLKTVAMRAGCITGPNHKGAKLHGFLSFLVKSCLKFKRYEIIGYKGKQVRDNLHANDLVRCFWEFFKKPKFGEVYNIGGGRLSNCSILEAISLVEKSIRKEIKIKIKNKNRTGDHKWYISNTNKFKEHYPNWVQKFSTKKIIDEIIYNN